jgi:hypothetical protein
MKRKQIPDLEYSAASNPTANNDGIDTATIGRRFFAGDIWVNSTTKVLFTCRDNTTGAAVWESEPYAAISNAPVTALINDNLTHESYAGLVPGTTYKFKVENASVADGGALTNVVNGWFKVATAAGAIVAEGGYPLTVYGAVGSEEFTVKIPLGSLKTSLYFLRDSETAFPVRLFLSIWDA